MWWQNCLYGVACLCQSESSFNNHTSYIPPEMLWGSTENPSIISTKVRRHNIPWCWFCVCAFVFELIHVHIYDTCTINVAHPNETPNDPSIFWHIGKPVTNEAVMKCLHIMCTIFLRGCSEGMRAFMWEYGLLSHIT